jgi:hypothetical protein
LRANSDRFFTTYCTVQYRYNYFIFTLDKEVHNNIVNPNMLLITKNDINFGTLFYFANFRIKLSYLRPGIGTVFIQFFQHVHAEYYRPNRNRIALRLQLDETAPAPQYWYKAFGALFVYECLKGREAR